MEETTLKVIGWQGDMFKGTNVSKVGNSHLLITSQIRQNIIVQGGPAVGQLFSIRLQPNLLLVELKQRMQMDFFGES